MACAIAACGRSAGPTQTLTKSIDLDKADSVTVDLHIGAGELRVAGGASKLMDATFRFNVPSWEPSVEYGNVGGRGTLTVRQPSSSTSFGNIENKWDLRLNDSVPLTINADVGAGESTLTLGSLNLRGVSIHVGAGELTVDLRGMPKQSYDVKVDGGVGMATIRVPRSVGVVATAGGGIGGVNVSGLQQQEGRWINPGHEHDPVTIHLDAHGGVGQIDISAE